MKVFNYLARATYPTLILWALYLYYCANSTAIRNQEMHDILFVVSCLMAAFAVVGIVGKFVFCIIEAVNEHKAEKNNESTKNE